MFAEKNLMTAECGNKLGIDDKRPVNSYETLTA
jgi:hypothetical protein